MSECVLILGESGSGKSTSIKHLPPKETFIIRCWKKRLPFRGCIQNYTECTTKNPSGNMVTSDNYIIINKILGEIDKNKTHIKYLVIDDSQYLMANQFMRNHSTPKKGAGQYDLFNSIADNFWKLISDSGQLREDLFVFFLHHTEVNDQGLAKPKTIGKLIDEKIVLAGMFSYVLLTQNQGGERNFLTQNDGSNPAKTPEGMFEDTKIECNLFNVATAIKTYYEGE